MASYELRYKQIESESDEEDTSTLRKVDFDRDIAGQAADYVFKRAYRMDKDTFDELHERLEHLIEDCFSCDTTPHSISTKIRLSCALRLLYGGSSLDLMITHGVPIKSIESTLNGVIKCMNACPDFAIDFKTIARKVKKIQRDSGK